MLLVILLLLKGLQMNLSKYQEFTRTTAIYPKNTAITYLTLGLASEAGEVAGKLKKHIRDNVVDTMSLIDEVGDVFWYAVRLCDELGFQAEEVLDRNRAKLQDRKDRDVIKGSGDKR